MSAATIKAFKLLTLYIAYIVLFNVLLELCEIVELIFMIKYDLIGFYFGKIEYSELIVNGMYLRSITVVPGMIIVLIILRYAIRTNYNAWRFNVIVGSMGTLVGFGLWIPVGGYWYHLGSPLDISLVIMWLLVLLRCIVSGSIMTLTGINEHIRRLSDPHTSPPTTRPEDEVVS